MNNLLTMFSGKGELWTIPKHNLINYEQLQEYIKSNHILVVNTLKEDMQHCNQLWRDYERKQK